MKKPSEKELWKHYMTIQKALYSILDDQNRLFIRKFDTPDDLKYSGKESLFFKDDFKTLGGRNEILQVPRYSHAVIMLYDDQVKRNDFFECKEQLESIYEQIKGIRYRRKHPKYIEGPIESVKISEKTAVASVTVIADSGIVSLGTITRIADKEIEELKTRCAAAGLSISVVDPQRINDVKTLQKASFTAPPSSLVINVEAADLLVFAKAEQLRRRIATGPQIVAHIRRPGEHAMRVPAGLIVIDYQEGLKATPTEPRKHRADKIYTSETDRVEFNLTVFEPIEIVGTFYRR